MRRRWVVHEQHGGSRYDLPRTGVGSVSGAASGFGTVISASISYSDTGADQFQYGRPPTSTSIWPGANTVAECGAGILDINGRRGSRSAKLIQTAVDDEHPSHAVQWLLWMGYSAATLYIK